MALNTTRRLVASLAVGIALAATVVLVDGSPALAAPTLHVSKTKGLADGEQITVYGTGFTASLQQIAIGQCIKNPTGPTDCNLSGGSQFTNADASGKTPTLTLKMAKVFSGHNCAGVGCVIAAQILPSTNTPEIVNANKASVTITFGSGGGTTTTSPTKTSTTSTKTATATSSKTTAAAAGATTTTNSAALPTTGPGLEWATMLMIGAALLLPGVGLIAMLPVRRRRIAQLR
ncbi:neocarzinostatin apoprotein domain-containing protein [Actinoplanes sp. CA-142083]|uniref:neocarzinostatin apoprotein domain-containing protein n=1 Tax=Actinoplanes sp. CA-142083 TaxID=3239903 RepID=UPI003D8DC17B